VGDAQKLTFGNDAFDVACISGRPGEGGHGNGARGIRILYRLDRRAK
jgi:hypothetical protein